MKTLFFTESSNNIGGQELQLLAQAVGLKARGYETRILCRPTSRIAQEARHLGLAVDLLDFRNAIHPPSIVRLTRLLRKHRPIAVVCHSGHDANLCALTVHGLSSLGLLRPRPRLIRMRTYHPGIANAFTYNLLFDQTFTPSQALKEQIGRNPAVLLDKIQVLYPGIDFDALEHAALNRLPAELAHLLGDVNGIQQRRPVIAHAAMFRGEKGHRFMLQVIKDLLPHFPNLLYVAAGEGDDKQAIAQEAHQLGLSDHVALPGMLNPVAPLIRRADVLVMPSTYEPLGMSQIEALSLGVPVVVSRVGGLPETVTDGVTGYLCPPPGIDGAQAEWVKALTAVLANPAMARSMAQQGREVVLRQFGRDSNIDALMGYLNC